MTAPSPINGVFVTGTDTEVGKTVVAGLIAAAARDQGKHIHAFKPVVTGVDEEIDKPHDHIFLQEASGTEQGLEQISPYTFGPPASPHLAAEIAEQTISRGVIEAAYTEAASNCDFLVCEGVGGLMVPLNDGYLVRDFAAHAGLPVVVVARPGLGTINHTLLTVEAARSLGLEVVAIAMTPWPQKPTRVEASNRQTVTELTGIQTIAIPYIDDAVLAIPSPHRLGQVDSGDLQNLTSNLLQK